VDLSRRNKLNSKKYGTKGEVTEQLALLLKSIWSCQYDPEISNQFKLVVDKYGSQYRGNNQHDAQEFLVWLLDKVHEDLNTATKKKYKIIKVSPASSLWISNQSGGIISSQIDSKTNVLRGVIGFIRDTLAFS
jgi:ubiquitin carboxyl-terminal hydrolase 31